MPSIIDWINATPTRSHSRNLESSLTRNHLARQHTATLASVNCAHFTDYTEPSTSTAVQYRSLIPRMSPSTALVPCASKSEALTLVKRRPRWEAAVFSTQLSFVMSLLRVTGTLMGRPATFLVDCGATSDFVSTAFLDRHSLREQLAATDRTVKGYDGVVKPASGILHATLTLDAAKHDGSVADSLPVRSFVAAPLQGEDAILGLPWLSQEEPDIRWSTGSISVRRFAVSPNGDETMRLVRLRKIIPRAGAHRRVSDSPCPENAEQRQGDQLSLVDELKQLYFATAETTESDPRVNGSLLELLARRHEAAQRIDAAVVANVGAAPAPKTPRSEAIEDKLAELRERMFKTHEKVFPEELPDGTPESRGELDHRIELKPGSLPIARGSFRRTRDEDDAIDTYVTEGTKKGWVQESHSSYAANPFQVPKKGTTEKRTVVDFRGINDQTVKSRYPLPRMDELFDRLQGAKYFSKIDLRSGFYQILLAPEDRYKTAFRTARGLFEYLVLPMGLCNAPATFMRLMNDVFRDFINQFVLVFLDDVVVYSNTLEEHIKHVDLVLNRLHEKKLYAKKSKCDLFKTEIEFLGHYVGVNGLRVMEDKLAAVTDWPVPQTVREVRAFLGLVGFYRRFIKDFSRVALPLTALTRTVTGGPFQWCDKAQTAFDTLKQSLQTAPILLLPDPSLPFVVHTDASGFAVGAVLQQDRQQGQGLQPVAYLSKKMNDAETRYPVHEQELLAIVTALTTWGHYLKGTHFTVATDHKSLIHFQTQPMVSGRQVRWLQALDPFDFTIEYVKGETNVTADGLSRRPDHFDPKTANGASPFDRPARVFDPSKAVGPAPTTKSQLCQCTIFQVESNEMQEQLQLAFGAHEARQQAIRQQQQRQQAIEAATRIVPPALDRPRPHPKTGVITMPSQRCTANNKKGVQCGARTTQGQYCWTHLRSLCQLRIKTSTIPLAGRGLFAERDFAAGEHIADYTGDLLRLRRDSDGGQYALALNSREAIDAARTNTAPGRSANDPRGSGQRPNSEFVINTLRRTGRLRATRAIQRGAEIFVSYGNSYHWANTIVETAAGLEADVTIELATQFRRAAAVDATYQTALQRSDRSPTDPIHTVDGLLFRNDALVVPNDAALRTQLIQECHDAPVGGHLGRDKTTEQVKRRFFWSGMDATINEYVTTCDTCQRNKSSQQAPMGLLRPLPIPPHAWHTVSLDLITGLPPSAQGNDAIVVFVCKLTKMVHYAACKTAISAAQLADLFLRTIFKLHGLPEALLSDRDPRFTAGFWKAFWEKMDTTLLMSTAYHAQTDGQTENANKTLETVLRSVVNFEQTDWDQHLHLVEFAVNSSKNATTGFTPFFLNYGLEPKTPIDIATAPLRAHRDGRAVDNKSADELSSKIKAAVEAAKANIEAAQKRQSHYADQHRRDHVPFQTGDRVLLASKNLQLVGDSQRTRKLTARYLGPFSVIRPIGENAYELQLPANIRIHPIVNVSQLKKYHDGSAAFPDRRAPHSRPEPEAIDGSGLPIYIAERVLESRVVRGQRQYLVKWEQFPDEESTWEPAAHLAGTAEGLIKDFEAREALQPRQSRRRTRTS
jgi:hypothetical protein